MKDQYITKSLKAMNKALSKKNIDDIHFDAICKRFEVCFEYTWKYLKRMATEAGQEVYSPKDALKEGVKLKLISNLDLWMDFLQERNLSVHNYYSGNPEDTLKKIKEFARVVKNLK